MLKVWSCKPLWQENGEISNMVKEPVRSQKVENTLESERGICMVMFIFPAIMFPFDWYSDPLADFIPNYNDDPFERKKPSGMWPCTL